MPFGGRSFYRHWGIRQILILPQNLEAVRSVGTLRDGLILMRAIIRTLVAFGSTLTRPTLWKVRNMRSVILLGLTILGFIQ